MKPFVNYKTCLQRLALAVLIAMLSAACSDDSPTSPDPGATVPVQWAAQLEGRWRAEGLFVAGLPLANIPVPAFGSSTANAMLTDGATDLAVSVSSESGGVYSLETVGTVTDTADIGHISVKAHNVWGSFAIESAGQLRVDLLQQNGKAYDPAQHYSGRANLLADTLLLEFDFASPPHKAIPFLGSSIHFLARLVRQ